MNTLEELNVYSSESVSVTDDRTYAVIFDTAVAVNQSISVALNQAHIVRLGNNVLEIINPPSGLTFSIDVGASGASVSWISSAPAGVTLDTSVPGVYTLSGITKNTHWDYAKSAVITPAVDSSTAFDYVCTIGFPEYAGETSRTWTTTTTITALGSYTSLSDVDFDPGYASPVTSYPTITSEGVTSRFRVTIAASELSNMTSTGGGSAVFSLGTYVITGTKTQVNARLSSLVLTSSSTSDFVMTYLVQNLETGVLTYYQQNVVKDLANAETANLGINRTYTENTVGLLFTDNYPDNIEAQSGETYTITLTTSSLIGKISLENAAYPVDWNERTRTWRFTGTQYECNQALRNVYFLPLRDTITGVSLTLKQYKGTLLQTSDTVTLSGVARTAAIPGTGLFIYSADDTFALTYEQAHYLNCDILVVAGGGAGGTGEYISDGNMRMGGGGGAGGVIYQQNFRGFETVRYLNNSVQFNVNVGAGGAQGTYNTQGANGEDSFISYNDAGYKFLPFQSNSSNAITVLTADNRIVGWGLNNNGSLGVGDVEVYYGITDVDTSENNWIMTSGSSTNVARVNSLGQCYMTGENGYGSIGNGTTGSTMYSTPVLVGGLYSKVVLGYAFAVGLQTNGQLRVWGLNTSGQLGLGNTVNKSTPTIMSVDTDWSDISTGYNNVLAVKTTGTLWRWGDGVSTATQVGTATNWVSVFDGYFAINTAGELYKIESGVATQVGTATNWVKAAHSESGFNLAINSLGELYSWGINTNGQLGLGNTTSQTNPTRVTGHTVADITCSDYNSYIIESTGELYSAGRKDDARLGDGVVATGNQTTFKLITPTILRSYGGGAGGITYWTGTNWIGVEGKSTNGDNIHTGNGGGGYGGATDNAGYGYDVQGYDGEAGLTYTQTVGAYTYYAGGRGAGSGGTGIEHGVTINNFDGQFTYSKGGNSTAPLVYGDGGDAVLLNNSTHDVMTLLNVPTADPDYITNAARSGSSGVIKIKFYE